MQSKVNWQIWSERQGVAKDFRTRLVLHRFLDGNALLLTPTTTSFHIFASTVEMVKCIAISLKQFCKSLSWIYWKPGKLVLIFNEDGFTLNRFNWNSALTGGEERLIDENFVCFTFWLRLPKLAFILTTTAFKRIRMGRFPVKWPCWSLSRVNKASTNNGRLHFCFNCRFLRVCSFHHLDSVHSWSFDETLNFSNADCHF